MSENKGKPKAIEEEDDLEEDETLSERLFGLTEMLPENVRKCCCQATSYAGSAAKNSFWLLRNVVWLATSTAVILVLPVIFESERAQQHEVQLQQQRQILLGPNAAVSGSGGASGSLLPGMGMVPPTPPAQS